MKFKITYLTSVHLHYDTRIFIKECSSLAKVESYDVSLIVADGLGNEEKAVLERYNWSIEEKKLIEIYKELI